MNLELMAMVWLRTEKRCTIVLRERTPRWACGQPDVLGVTRDRYLIEIEIKRSVSDFRADFKKRHRINRDHYLDKQPKQFYYFAPTDIARKIEPDIPEWAGLMHCGPDTVQQVNVIKKAPANKLSERLTIKEYLSMVAMLTNHLLSSEASRDRIMSHRNLNEPWNYGRVDTYQI